MLIYILNESKHLNSSFFSKSSRFEVPYIPLINLLETGDFHNKNAKHITMHVVLELLESLKEMFSCY